MTREDRQKLTWKIVAIAFGITWIAAVIYSLIEF